MSAVGLVGQQRSEAVGPGSNLYRVTCLYDFTDICQKFHFVVLMAQCVGEQGSEAVGPGLSLSCQIFL